MTLSESKARQTKKAPAETRKRAVFAAAPAPAHYDEDFARWAFEQAKALRDGDLTGLDIENIAEELETLGRGEFNKLESILTVLVTHMLKWDRQPERRSRSWAITIRIQRRHAAKQLKDNPSLKPRLGEALAEAHETARLTAANETGLPLRSFPPDCPYSWLDVTERPFAIDADDA
jgi:hypothetical protein